MAHELLVALGHTRPVFWHCDDKKKEKEAAARLVREVGGQAPERVITPFEVRGEPDIQVAGARNLGTFFTVNELGDVPNESGNLRHEGNVLRPLACFADFDHGTYEEQVGRIMASPLAPSAWVKSGHGYHIYWFLDGTTKEDLARWSKVQRAIAAFFGGDAAVSDPARLMRLPDSWHCKDSEPKQVKLERIDTALRYGLEDLEREFPSVDEAAVGSEVSRLLANTTGEGGRNTAATKVIGALLNRFKPHEWESLAWPMAKSWNLKMCNPPDEERILRGTFESLVKAETEKRAQSEKGMITFREGDMKAIMSEEGENIIAAIAVEDGVARFTFWNIEQSKQDTLNTMLSVDLLIPSSHPKPFTMRINLFSHSAMESFARSLSKSLGSSLKWDHLLNTAQSALIKHLSERDLSVDLSTVPDEECPMLFAPFLVKDGANLLFGDGGTGKTYFCLRLALSLATGMPFLGYTPQEAVPTLFVDYEDNEKTASFRLSRLCADPALGISPTLAKMSVRYLNPQGAPLYTIVPALKKIIREHNIGLVLVDSVASACGAEPEKAEAAAQYYNALKALNVTSLSIAHVVKTEGSKQDKAFGSVFWHNLARNTWNIQGEEDADVDVGTLGSVMGEKSRQLGMFHRKFNSGPKSRPISMKITYGTKDVRFEEGQSDYWNKDKKLETRIMECLRTTGGRTKIQLAEDLLDVPDKTLKNVLSILKQKGQVSKDDARGGKYYVRDYVSRGHQDSPEV